MNLQQKIVEDYNKSVQKFYNQNIEYLEQFHPDWKNEENLIYVKALTSFGYGILSMSPLKINDLDGNIYQDKDAYAILDYCLEHNKFNPIS